MMEALRKHMKKLMWFIAVAFIAGMFFWYGKVGGIKNYIAKVNGAQISVKDYNKRVMQQLRRERERQDKELSEEQIMQIRRQILSSMITQEVIYQESKKMGIIVPDEEVINTIHNLPQFQQDGKFNFNLYLQTLRYSINADPEEFEDLIRRDIANRKLEKMILSSAKLTDAELQLQYVTKNGNLKNFDEKKEELKNDILQYKRTALYRNWMASLQQKTKIKVNIELTGITGPKQ